MYSAVSRTLDPAVHKVRLSWGKMPYLKGGSNDKFHKKHIACSNAVIQLYHTWLSLNTQEQTLSKRYVQKEELLEGKIKNSLVHPFVSLNTKQITNTKKER